MLEIIVLLVYLSRLVALARSRGRSLAWAFGGLAVWMLCDTVGVALAPEHRMLATAIGLPLALFTAALYHRMLYHLDHLEHRPTVSLGDNFPCPRCASVQTEDRSGHLSCNACGDALGAT